MMTKAYILQGSTYYRYDVEADAVDAGYPRQISNGWSNIDPRFAGGTDTAIDTGSGHLYFFEGDTYQRIDQVANTADASPELVGANWPGMSDAGFGEDIDACLMLPGFTAAFFRGDQYVIYDLVADRVEDGYPRTIAEGWPGLDERGFADALDAAVRWLDGRVFFFKGTSYLRYDADTGTVTGEPRAISDGWPGLPDIPIDAIWIKTAPVASSGGAGALQPGDALWYWNGKVSRTPDIPRLQWFPHANPTDPTDYLGNGKDIYNLVVHANGEILRGQPHLRTGAGTYGWLNRNPGNLTGARGGRDFGQYRDKFNWHNFMIFPTMEAGHAAIIPFILGWGPMTIAHALAKYAPRSDGNDPTAYAADVAAAAGVPVTTLTTDLTPFQLEKVSEAIKRREGVREGTTLRADSPELPAEVRALL
jgi:hypothetical protein